MQAYPVQQDQSKFDKKAVNHAIRICVNCGNTSVRIQNCRILCKDCGSFFDMERKHNE